MPVYAITGANRGIGLGYVQHLSSASADNTIIAIVRDTQKASAGLKALVEKHPKAIHLVEADVANADSIDSLATKIPKVLGSDAKKIDYLINNAAINQDVELTSLNLTEDVINKHIGANVLGPARVTTTLLPFLADRAVVANISSGMGSISKLANGNIKPHVVPYSISKAALNIVSVQQAKELEGRGVIVLVIDPGHVKTDMGGRGAVLEVEESVSGVLKVIHGATEKDSGKFYEYNGKTVPW